MFAYVGNDPINSTDPEGLSEYDLGSGWRARVDTFNTTGGLSSHEIHVFDNAGNETGVFGPKGWINKHGFQGTPQEFQIMCTTD